MPTKHKPRLNWRSGGSGSTFPFSEKKFNELSKILNVPKLDRSIEKDLQQAARDYLDRKRYLNESPRLSEQRAMLEKLYKISNEFQKCLKSLDGASLGQLRSADFIYWINNNGPPQRGRAPSNIHRAVERYLALYKDGKVKRHPIELDTIINRCIKDTSKIIKFSKQAMEKIPIDKGGPFTDYALISYVEVLASIYEDATGERPTITWRDRPGERYGGIFYSFIEASIKLIDPKSNITNDGLGRIVKAVVSTRKKHISKQ